MISEYLVIKLPGNWIEREQMRIRLSAIMGEMNLDEAAVAVYRGHRLIPKELPVNIDYMDYVKKNMCKALAEKLLQEGLIRFESHKVWNGTEIECKLPIIYEKPKGGEPYVQIR